MVRLLQRWYYRITRYVGDERVNLFGCFGVGREDRQQWEQGDYYVEVEGYPEGEVCCP